MLGFLRPSEDNGNVKAQIAKLKQQFQDNQSIVKKHAMKYNELLSFANVMSEGYIASMQVIIDVSGLLASYKDLLGEISRGMADFDNLFKNGINQNDIEKLKHLTDTNLKQINDVFAVEYDKLYNLISSTSGTNSTYLTDLEKVKGAVSQVGTKSATLGQALAQGGGKKRRSSRKNVPKKQ